MSTWKKSILLFCKRHNFRQSCVFSQVVIHTFLLSLNEISLLNIFRDILNLSLKFRECMKDSVCDTHNYQSIFWIFSINFPQSSKSKWKDKTLFSYESMSYWLLAYWSTGCMPGRIFEYNSLQTHNNPLSFFFLYLSLGVRRWGETVTLILNKMNKG